MGLIASDKGGEFELVKPGLHHAVCYAVVDLGTQINEMYQNKQHKIWIAFEIPKERITMMENGQEVDRPRVISEFFTLSLGEKANLRAFLENWRGTPFTDEQADGFDILNLVGVGAMIQVAHKPKKAGGKRAFIQTIIPRDKVHPKLVPENPLIKYSIEDQGKDIPETVPDGIRKMIEGCEEFKMMQSAGEALEEFGEVSFESSEEPEESDDLPF